MVPLGGKDLPVVLPNGLVLLRGSCFVSAEGVFEITLEYKGDAEGLGAPYSIRGSYTILGAADDQAQQPARFIAREKGMRIVPVVTRSGLNMGSRVRTQRFEAETEGAFFINGLRIGGGITTITSEVIVFKRLPILVEKHLNCWRSYEETHRSCPTRFSVCMPSSTG
jgi:hypothetical protein